MRITSGSESLAQLKCDLLVVTVSEGEVKRKVAKSDIARVDDRFEKRILSYLRKDGFDGTDLKTSLFRMASDRSVRAVLVVGFQPETKKQVDQFESIEKRRKLGHAIFQAACELQAKSIAILSSTGGLTEDEHLSALVEGVELSRYQFLRFKSEADKHPRVVRSVQVLSRKKVSQAVVRRSKAVSEATCFARDLVNMPPADCQPRYLVSRARALGKQHPLKVTVLDRKRLKSMGANALLGVAQGSSAAPYLIKIVYRPKSRSSRVISLVGKGVTFDSGGYSIKSGPGMADMKCDMAGAAAVLGCMKAVAALKPAAEVRAYIPAVENMISGSATKPGDVFRALNGKTIEVLNTDAEGRLILADALSLAVRDGCDEVIDLATLTGACVIALGTDYAGLFSSSDRMAKDLSHSGVLAGERLWRMPLSPEYKKLLKSNVADVKNIGGKSGGAITAALFLQEFVGEQHWSHLDIAGPSFRQEASEYLTVGGVGFGVRTLCRYLERI